MAGLSVLNIALAYVRAGLSVLPVALDGSKAPDGRLLPRVLTANGDRLRATWDPFKERLATEAELRQWFGRQEPPGIGIIGGEVSGRMECIDFDRQAEAIFPAWSEMVEAQCPGLIARLSVARTPKPGFHVRYRCREIPTPGNTKLAIDPAAPSNDRTLIETRGEGGYAIAPGSPAACHQSGRLYEHHTGPTLADIADIGANERQVMIACAQSFNHEVLEEHFDLAASSHGLRPGDDYNARGPDWPAILEPHGWVMAYQNGKERRWRRPGKSQGVSATTGYCTSKAGNDLLAVFSSNAAPFDGMIGGRPGTYSKFTAYTLLNHHGDFRAAAKALAEEGFGSPPSNGTAQVGPAPPAGAVRAYRIIQDYWRKEYQPTHRRGGSIYSEVYGREVGRVEALCGAPDDLIGLLGDASDRPALKEGTDPWQALPGFFRKWAPSAWACLLRELRDEGAAEEVGVNAQEEFQDKLAAALLTMVTFGISQHQRRGHDPDQESQRRSLVEWANLWAKPGPWKAVRSYRLWCRRDQEGGRLLLCLRSDLFGQLPNCALSGIGKRFAVLARQYGVALPGRARPQGREAVELCPDFIDGLLSGPEIGVSFGVEPPVENSLREP